MKKYMMIAMIMVSTFSLAVAQFGNQGYASNDDRYYYDNDFDWHWDVRVRISDGIQRGLITQHESNRLYRRLEDLERKEYIYQSDGFYNSYEQQEVWNDVIYLNREVGVELSDYDRTFYGFDVYGYDRRGYPRGYYQGGFDFFRFDKRGFGSIRLGYVARPNYNGWYRNNDNRIAQRYCNERREYGNRGNFQRGDERGNRDRRGGYDSQYSNNSNRGDYDKNRGNYDNNRNSQSGNNRVDRPNYDPLNGGERNGGGYSQKNRIEQPNIEPNRSDTNVEIPPASRSDRPNFQLNKNADNNEKSGNDWNGNRGGANQERPIRRRGNG